MTDLVGHFLLFAVVGVVFLALPLIAGLFVRPTLPTAEKKAAYECGEPTIGSSYVQFDLRFYVVALLFIIFDVEIAFFFPWAVVYGGAAQLADQRLAPQSPARVLVSKEMLNVPASATLPENQVIDSKSAYQLLLTGLADILVFFGVLLVGFAYVWKRGDLDWVRSQQAQQAAAPRPPPEPAPPALAPGAALEPVH